VHDLVKDMFGTKMTPFQDQKDVHQTDAFLDFDYIFRYGIFGYGYTQQIYQKNIAAHTLIKESLLFRGTVFCYRKTLFKTP